MPEGQTYKDALLHTSKDQEGTVVECYTDDDGIHRVLFLDADHKDRAEAYAARLKTGAVA